MCNFYSQAWKHQAIFKMSTLFRSLYIRFNASVVFVLNLSWIISELRWLVKYNNKPFDFHPEIICRRFSIYVNEGRAMDLELHGPVR